MGILIRPNEVKNTLVIQQNQCVVDNRFFELIKELIELNKKRDHLQNCLSERNRVKSMETIELQRLVKEQEQIIEKIKLELNQSKELYNQAIQSGMVNLLGNNKRKLGELYGKQEQNSSMITRTITSLKSTSNALLRLENEKQLVESQIKATLELVNIEYSKINWHEACTCKLYLALTFENIKDDKLKNTLKQLTRKNIELERIILQMFYKLCDKMLKKHKCQNRYKLFEQIQQLVIINNKIYGLVDSILSVKIMLPETEQLLYQLERMLEYVCNVAEQGLVKEQVADISCALVSIQDKIGCDHKIILKSYRPAFFYKNGLKNYSFNQNAVNEILEQAKQYSKTTSSNK